MILWYDLVVPVYDLCTEPFFRPFQPATSRHLRLHPGMSTDPETAGSGSNVTQRRHVMDDGCGAREFGWRREVPIARRVTRAVGWLRAGGLILGLPLAAACARGPVVVEETPEAVVCRHGSECDAKWRRARQWVGMHSHWPIREDTDALIATDGPDDTRYPAFVIRRVASGTSAGSDVIVFGAGCTDQVRAFVDHVPARGARWRNVTGPDAKYTECTPPVDELEASFVGYVNGSSR